MLKGTKIYSIYRSKCPRCMEGDIYPDSNPYRYKTLVKFNARCSYCDLNFEPEPNFYYGAMYVSYAYTVALFVAVYAIFGELLHWSMWPIIGALGVTLVVLTPIVFRVSRTTWLSLFVSYDKSYLKKN